MTSSTRRGRKKNDNTTKKNRKKSKFSNEYEWKIFIDQFRKLYNNRNL